MNFVDDNVMSQCRKGGQDFMDSACGMEGTGLGDHTLSETEQGGKESSGAVA